MNRAKTTIDDMEATAADFENSLCSKRIRGEWLEVERCLNNDNQYYYTYKWGKNMVSREVAANVLATV